MCFAMRLRRVLTTAFVIQCWDLVSVMLDTTVPIAVSIAMRQRHAPTTELVTPTTAAVFVTLTIIFPTALSIVTGGSLVPTMDRVLLMADAAIAMQRFMTRLAQPFVMMRPHARAMACVLNMETALAKQATTRHRAIGFAMLLPLVRATALVHRCPEVASVTWTFMAVTAQCIVLRLFVTLAASVRRLASVFAILDFLAQRVLFV
jgi:hypothetical protein